MLTFWNSEFIFCNSVLTFWSSELISCSSELISCKSEQFKSCICQNLLESCEIKSLLFLKWHRTWIISACPAALAHSQTSLSLWVAAALAGRIRAFVARVSSSSGATGSGMSSWIPVWMPSRRRLYWPSPPPSPSTSRRCSSSDPMARARPSRWPRLSNTYSSSLTHGEQP